MFEEESEADDPGDVSVDFECDEYLEQQQQQARRAQTPFLNRNRGYI